MKGIFGTSGGKMAILKVLVGFAVAVVGVTGHLRGVEGAVSVGNWRGQGRILTESEVEEVKAIWRVIGDQEIVTWDGKEWLAKIKDQKIEAVKRACEAWQKAGYQRIGSIKYFVEDVDKYYNHKWEDSKKALETKVGLVLSLSAFFGMKR